MSSMGNNLGRNVVVIGTQWGDEGKGPVTHEGVPPSNSPKLEVRV